MLEEVDDLVAGDLLGIEEHVEAHVLEDELVLGQQVGLVIDAGDDTLGAQPLGEEGADDVHGLGLGGVHRDEKVRLRAAGFPEDLDGGGVAEDGDHVGRGVEPLEPRIVVVDDGDVSAFVAEHLRQVGPHLAGPFDDDLHTSVLVIRHKDTQISRQAREDLDFFVKICLYLQYHETTSCLRSRRADARLLL